MTTNPMRWCGGCQQDQSTHEDVRDTPTKKLIIIRCDICGGALSMDITNKDGSPVPTVTIN